MSFLAPKQNELSNISKAVNWKSQVHPPPETGQNQIKSPLIHSIIQD